MKLTSEQRKEAKRKAHSEVALSIETATLYVAQTVFIQECLREAIVKNLEVIRRRHLMAAGR